MGGKVRILIAKPGLDGHDRGAKFVARALKDAGYEVIYTGIRQTPEAIAAAAVDEDVSFVGLSCLSGAHNHLFPAVVEEVRKRGGDDIVFFGGGIIPRKDWDYLKSKGIEVIFGPGTKIEEILSFIESKLAEKGDASKGAGERTAESGGGR